MTINGQLEEAEYDNEIPIEKHFLIDYKLENIYECIDDKKLALDKERFAVSTNKKDLSDEGPTKDDEKKPANDAVPFTVNETIEVFYTAKQAYQTLKFNAHNHADIYGITSEDWLTYIDLEIKPLKSKAMLEKIIAIEIHQLQKEGKPILRIYDPKFSIFYNQILFDKKTILQIKKIHYLQ